MIPFAKPSFGTEEEEAALRVIRSGQLSHSTEVEAFEDEFSEYIGAPYVIAVDNCTNALFLALQYLWERKGRLHVKCPAMTFASVANVITQTHHELEFNDTYQAGMAYRLEGTNIWDCAHELLPYIHGQVMCYSFYPNKVLSSAEGGAIATDDPDMAAWFRLARWNGRTTGSYHNYFIEFPGWKMNMTDMQAALARVQLQKVDGFLKRRTEIQQKYKAAGIQQVNEGNYLYVISVPDREKFMDQMKQEGIELSYHYKPLYDQPAYIKLRFRERFSHTEHLKNSIVTLPLYPAMSDTDVEHVINATNDALKAYVSVEQTEQA